MDAYDSHNSVALESLDRNQVAHGCEYYGEGSHTTPDDGSSSKISPDGATIGPNHDEQSPANKKLRQRKTSLYLVAFYVAISVYSWVVLCVLSRRHASSKLGIAGTRLYRAAKFLSGAAGVFAFPVATALCARAVVPYVQAKRNGLTLRQTMFLVDRSWKNPSMWSLGTAPKRKSPFFWSAALLHVIGFLILPLQHALVGEGVVKKPGNYGHVDSVIDFSDLLRERAATPGSVLVQKLRYAIASVLLDDVDPYIWVDTSDCGSYSVKPVAPRCEEAWLYHPTGTRHTLSNLVPGKSFISPALSTFNTGLVRQFAPRLNSTVSYSVVPMDDFPADCANLPGSFYAEYSGTTDDNPHYSVEACMPSNQTNTPWKNQFRTPQTISEVLYLKIFVNGKHGPFVLSGFSGGPTVFKVQADSTSGYFELPNYLNNNTAGGLLPRDPDEFCDEHCTDQGYGPVIITNNRDKWSASQKSKRWTTDFSATKDPGRERVEFEVHMEYENSEDFDTRVNLGPLYTVAEALFGNSSFIAARSHSPLAFTGNPFYNRRGPCRDLAPLVSLMTERWHGYHNYDVQQVQLDCVGRVDDTEIIWQVANWLGLFWVNDSSIHTGGLEEPRKFQMERTLTAAVYLANKGWLLDGVRRERGLVINFDIGNDAPVPVISTAGIIIISVLLGIFLLGLIAIAVYVYSVPTFTATLDAFVMLQLGAQLSRDYNTTSLPALSANDMMTDALDLKPGWFGDGEPDEVVGRVELGADARLRNDREYQAS